ncbi:MAG: hypothetical protein QME74_09235 [Candidatus Edwardsbacteria bacterium]|nr:hypothetical protein [Candidatus Edwardsbacteria bacterium]
MHILKERFVVDRSGKRLGVYLDMTDYKRLLAQAEMAESIAAYDAAKKTKDEAIPFAQAVAELRKTKRK